MASIQQYPLTTPKAADTLVGTKVPTSTTGHAVTSTFEISAVAALANAINLGYTSYTALVNQTGVTAPVSTELANTTGATVAWTYSGVGNYKLTFTGITLAVADTIVFLNNGSSSAIDPNVYWTVNIGDNSIIVRTSTDVILTNAAFEVRIYS
jgi:hypothetical protein